MPLDGRVLIAVLVALFLALGAGILVGSLLPGEGAVFRRQEVLVDRLEADLAGLLGRVQGMEQQLERARLDARAEAVLARGRLEELAAGRLGGRRVAVVQVGEGPDPRPLLEVLQAAGAVVCCRARVDSAWLRGERSAAAAAAALAGGLADGGAGVAAEGAGLADAARALAWALTGGQGGAEVLAALGQRGLVRFSGAPEPPAQSVVLLLGRAEPGAQALFLRPFLRQSRALSLSVVGCEASWTNPSLLPACLVEGIPTVAHVDLASGQLCVVAALGEGRGQYGLVAPSRPLPAWVPAGG